MLAFTKKLILRNQGMSLIELMVSLGISTIVIFGGYKLYLEFTSVQVNAARSKSVQQEMSSLGEVVRNQFSTRASQQMTSTPYELKDLVGTWMRTLEIVSIPGSTGTPIRNSFTTICESLPSKHQELNLAELYDGQFVPCQLCSSGSLPVVQISSTDDSTSTTTTRNFPPLWDNSGKRDVLAMGICFKETQGVAVYIEAAWVTQDKRVERTSQVIKLDTSVMDKIKIVR